MECPSNSRITVRTLRQANAAARSIVERVRTGLYVPIERRAACFPCGWLTGLKQVYYVYLSMRWRLLLISVDHCPFQNDDYAPKPEGEKR